MEIQNSQQSSSLFGLAIDPNSKAHLTETAKWTKFLAIAGFIIIGLMIIYGVVISSVINRSFSRLSETMSEEYPDTYPVTAVRTMMIIYMVVLGLIYFFPCLFTLRFSNNMKLALQNGEQEKLATAFQNLKITVRYLGILTIIGLVLIALGIITFLITISTMRSFH
ncbi:MAG: hypothetical protein C4308_07735 [Chitinophagaceae bacterium]